MDKQKSKKIVLNTLKITGATVAVFGVSLFIVAAFNTFINEQHARFEREAERAFKRALQQQQNTSDTIVYNAQNSR